MSELLLNGGTCFIKHINDPDLVSKPNQDGYTHLLCPQCKSNAVWVVAHGFDQSLGKHGKLRIRIECDQGHMFYLQLFGAIGEKCDISIEYDCDKDRKGD